MPRANATRRSRGKRKDGEMNRVEPGMFHARVRVRASVPTSPGLLITLFSYPPASGVKHLQFVMKNSVNPAGLSVAEQFVDFLNSQELFRPENANCESCGSKMHYKEFQFWLAG